MGEYFEMKNRLLIDQALEELRALDFVGADIGQLQAQVKKLVELTREQAKSLHRLELSVSVLGQLLIEQGTLQSGAVDAKVAALLEVEAQQRQQAKAKAAAEKAEAARHSHDAESARANAPTKCHRCGKTFPYHTGFMTEVGMVCSSCLQP